MQLRPYQGEAVASTYTHLQERDDNPLIVIPTGGGKTPVIATFCRDAVMRWGGRVIVLAHVKELLEQTVEKIRMMYPEMALRVGVYSAGLKRRDMHHSVIVAGIQSVWNKACELDAFDLAIVDEAHLIPPDGEGRYKTFFAYAKTVNPNLRIIGLTATPYRLKSGMICGPNNMLNHVCFEVGVKELIDQGYLCPLRSKAGKERADLSGLHVRAGEFIQAEIEAAMDTDHLVEAACSEIIEESADRQSVLVFAAGVKHARRLAEEIERQCGLKAGQIFGDTAAGERKTLLEEFKAGRLKYLVNCNVLTTGFDAPGVDCVALVRPTFSPGLYYQMVGRGFRLAPQKTDCKVLDFGGNIMRHGPVDKIRIRGSTPKDKTGDEKDEEEVDDDPSRRAKECPECRALLDRGVLLCPQCGHQFPPPEKKHDAQATTQGILSGQLSIETVPVKMAMYSVWRKTGTDKPATMRVLYQVHAARYESEWICLNHDGWARKKAESWWSRRSNTPPPDNVDDAVRLANSGALCDTTEITIRQIAGEKFPTIIGYKLGEKPPAVQLETLPEEIPF